MSERFPGGLITLNPPATTGGMSGSAPGVWTLDQAMQKTKEGVWPVQPVWGIEDVFSTYLYTGTGSAQTITNDMDLAGKGGLTWIKGRSTSWNHTLYDTVRGVSVGPLNTADSAAPNPANNDRVTAFNSNGFTLGANGNVNGSGYTYTAWSLRKQPKFFDVVTFTSNSNGSASFNHSLGATPGCIIIKCTGTADPWYVWHRSVGNDNFLKLEQTSAQTGSTGWCVPTSTSATVTAGFLYGSQPHVAYVFAHDAGGFGVSGTDNVISCGSYTGATTGTQINLGWEPQWLLIKCSSTTTNWFVVDNMRGWTAGGIDKFLYPNTAGAEYTDGNDYIELNANGFKIGSDGFFQNANVGGTQTFVYVAIRRGPMKVPTDATKVFKPSTYTGTSATAQITNVPFAPDMLYSPGRSNADNTRGWFDRLRGINNVLQTNSAGAEDPTYVGTVTAFNNNGVTLGPNYAFVNYSGYTYVEYFFGRAPNFFDEVCYTGTGSAKNVSHNLGAVPELIIFKRRNASSNWPVYAAPSGQGYFLLNYSDPFQADTTTFMNNTAPTSTAFTVGTDVGQSNPSVNASGALYVAYLFATCPGVSKVGTFTANGTDQVINCGFAAGARFIMYKQTNALGDWYVYDSARGITSSPDPFLLINSTAAENSSYNVFDADASGFKIRGAIFNTGTFIYLAIA